MTRYIVRNGISSLAKPEDISTTLIPRGFQRGGVGNGNFIFLSFFINHLLLCHIDECIGQEHANL